MTFDQYIASYVLGRLLSSDLPRAATQGLEEGYDSVDLAALAGSTSAERSTSEQEELWKRGLQHVNKPVPNRAEAGRILTDYYASLVSSGAFAPRMGAAEIVHLANDLDDVIPSRNYVGDGLGVARILGLYYSYGDVPSDDDRAISDIDEEIIAECRRIECKATT